MPARDEQIGQCAGHQQAMFVLVQPAIAHLGKAEHPLANPDDMIDPGAHFGLGAVFRSLDLIHDAAVAVAAIGEIPRLGRMFPDHRPLAAVGLIAPHARLFVVYRSRGSLETVHCSRAHLRHVGTTVARSCSYPTACWSCGAASSKACASQPVVMVFEPISPRPATVHSPSLRSVDAEWE